MAIDGDELCTLGSVDGAITVFGTALLFVADRDAWVGWLRGAAPLASYAPSERREENLRMVVATFWL